MTNMTLKEIGKVIITEEQMQIQIHEPYRQGLIALEDFSHLIALYWANESDETDYRNMVVLNQQVYRKGPEQMGIFATRSAYRPNPLLISTIEPISIDVKNGLIELPFIDAFDGTPVLDIKPYTPSVDRIDNYQSPDWCQHWPKNVETSGDFPWEKEFLF